MINEDIMLNHFLRVDEDVIVDENPSDDEILYSIQNNNGNGIE